MPPVFNWSGRTAKIFSSLGLSWKPGLGGGDAPATPATITIDFSSTSTVAQRLGFLHSIDATNPPNAMFYPLHPDLWRFNWTNTGVARMAAAGASREIVLSDEWVSVHGSTTKPVGGARGAGTFYQLVVDRVTALVTAGTVPENFESWNEYDLTWLPAGKMNGTVAELAAIAEDARLAILAVLGASGVGGNPVWYMTTPSVSFCSTGATGSIANIFKALAAIGTARVDFVAWHELGIPDNISRGTNHIGQVKTTCFNNTIPGTATIGSQDCTGLGAIGIHINESIGSGDPQHSPGVLLFFVEAFEHGNIQGACHSCWTDAIAGVVNCGNESLDGLLTNGTLLPRGVWWGANAYGRLSTGRAAASASIPEVTGLQSTNLFSGGLPGAACHWATTPTDSTVDLTMVWNNLSSHASLVGKTKVHVNAQLIPHSGENAVASLTTAFDADVTVSGNSITADLGKVQLNEMVQWLLTPVGGGGGGEGKGGRSRQGGLLHRIWSGLW